jgi:YggT family protein
MANPIIWLILTVLDIYFWILVATVILSWLVSFNVINGQNPYVRQIRYALMRLTEPVLGPIRRMLPDLGGIDISPIIAAIGIQFVQYVVVYYGSQLL